MSDAEMVPVTDEDRKAAAALVRWQQKATDEWQAQNPEALRFFAADFSRAILQGIWDEHPVVQAFASHRLAAEAAALEKAAGLAEMGDWDSWTALATAIRSLKEGASHVGEARS